VLWHLLWRTHFSNLCGFSWTALWHVTTIFAKIEIGFPVITSQWRETCTTIATCAVTFPPMYMISIWLAWFLRYWQNGRLWQWTVTTRSLKAGQNLKFLSLTVSSPTRTKPATLMYLPRVFSVPKIPHRSWWIVTPRFRPVSIDPSVVEVSVGSPNGQVYQKIKLQ